MNRYDLLYRVYEEFDTRTLRHYQRFIDVFPPVDSRIALEHWESAYDELERRKDAIAAAVDDGREIAELVSRATREQAFEALDLYSTYGKTINVLILDVDETLRSAGSTDNEIPRSTLALLTDFYESGIPIIICTGQTLENVKGFAIQGLGAAMVQSGSVSIVYEAGTGVFTPNHQERTKQLLYADLNPDTVQIFETIRSRILSDAPAELRRSCHLQGNEFNVTLKPNYAVGSERAHAIIETALIHLIDLLGAVVADNPQAARNYYAASDPEIAAIIADIDADPGDIGAISSSERDQFDRITVGYYPGDAAEITSNDLNKVAGVNAALDVLDITDPFGIVLGDSNSDLQVMEWFAAEELGVAAAPSHASSAVLEHVRSTDDLVFHPGRSVDILRIIDAMNRLAQLEE